MSLDRFPGGQSKQSRPRSRLAGIYDALYANNENTFGGGKPEEVVLAGARLLPKDAEVMEVGAGQGRNAIALAEQGYDVTAVDISVAGIDSIANAAKEKSLPKLHARVEDVRDGLSGQYDMIVSTSMLHHLSRKEGLRFVTEMQQHTKSGGLNAITAFTSQGDDAIPGLENQFYVSLEELRALYAGWDILAHTEKSAILHDTKEDGIRAMTEKAEILARKPKIEKETGMK